MMDVLLVCSMDCALALLTVNSATCITCTLAHLGIAALRPLVSVLAALVAFLDPTINPELGTGLTRMGEMRTAAFMMPVSG